MKAHVSDAEIVEVLKVVVAEGGQRPAARKIGINQQTVNNYCQLAKVRGLTADSPVMTEIEKLRLENRVLKDAVNLAKNEANAEDYIREQIFQMAARPPEPPAWLTKGMGKNGFRGAPMTMWSDWHYGEVVLPVEVGGTNEFNAEIAKARIKRLVDTTVDLCFHHMGRAKTNYPGIIVAINGDIMTGDIHQELAETNDRTPQAQINDLTDLIISAIENLALKFGNVVVFWTVGNHGRDTMKPRMKARVRCLDAATPVLTDDLRWVPAGQLRKGDGLYAFEEDQVMPRGRRYAKATVTHAGTAQTETIRIELKSGQVFYATPEHKFLAHGIGTNKAEWCSAATLLKTYSGKRRKNFAGWSIDRYVNVWEQDTSYEAGYLAGVFDGEATFVGTKGNSGHRRAQLCLTQYDNACLAETKRCLRVLGFDFHESRVVNRYGKNCHYLTIRGGINEVMRFLGQVRPKRLLAKWLAQDAHQHMVRIGRDDIVSVTPGGVREIATISSSSKTYLSAGYASHNTSHEWVIGMSVARYFRKNKHVTIIVPNETDIHFRVYGTRFLQTHGDSLGVKGGDGIIGAIGPIMRGSIKTGRSEAHVGKDFDWLILGHWHQMLWLPGVIVNNSLKGYDEFARLALRAPYSRPSQALWFVHPEHGITAKWEVFLEGLKHAAECNEWVAWQQNKGAVA